MNKILGDLLKNTRENKGLTLDDLAQETKIQKRYLIDLEQEEFDDLPGKVYERGFLKTYANALGLGEKEVLDIYEELRGEKKVEKDSHEHHNIHDEKHKKGKLKIFMWMIIIIFVAFGVVKMLEIIDKKSPATENVLVEEEKTGDITEPKQETEVSGISESEIEEVLATTETAIAPSIAKKVEIKLTGKVWLQVFVNGQKVKEGEFSANEPLLFEGAANDQIFVKIGNIKNADVFYNGTQEDESIAYKNVWKKTF